MKSLNELIKELSINEVIKALVTAYRLGNVDYLASSIELLHEELTYTVSENETLTGDALERASKLHALYCLGLGLLRSLGGGSPITNYDELVNAVLRANDLSSLTQFLMATTMQLVKGDYSLISKVTAIHQEVGNELIKGIISSFLNLVNILSAT
ncbi:hypothetical protein [Vulcanisaeta souniana]|uniref:Uncharacterized protein n=1 Tax=Vulcanisaeta souniana JCM 11219 TaxID=1293586 RepID=A0A830E099_9CREN|nr:hypothetical protein [Vulcanisaeta souniana]BDR91849.1 hypothetical protein Vsou_09420 [Vulcanisaeta souniana JCM 11219]GGI69869.1 hypothetical protein GCM10007112_03560 [Vulcanisaeta souniana JCM 11219]